MNTMNRTQKEISIAKNYLEMTKKEQDLLLEIMDLISGNPARREVAKNWTGKMKDLPAALAKI